MTLILRTIMSFIIIVELATIAVWIFVPSELIVGSDTHRNQFVSSAQQTAVGFLGLPEVRSTIENNSCSEMVFLKCTWPLLNLYDIGLNLAKGRTIVFSLQSYDVNKPGFWIFEEGYFYESNAAPNFLPCREVK